jgi:UDP:flavonoid glycosyltransferase YjiC (YdhE family)
MTSMSTILFATWDGGGNVPPAVAIASELQRRGHTVRFLGHESQREQLNTSGFAFSAYEGVRPFRSTDANSAFRQVSMFVERQLGRAVLVELDAAQADLVVVDCLLLPVLRACADAGQAYVSLEHLYDAYLRRNWLRGPAGLAGRLRRLDPVGCWDSAALSLAATLPALDPAGKGPLPPNLRFTGPTIEAPEPHDLDSHEPAVLVSLSTCLFPGMPAALQRLLDATADLDARVVVTTGPAIDPASLRSAANHEVHRYVPHDELMPQVSLVVGHGGHATTMRALAHDLPLVVMPMHPLLDQPMVGASVAGAGAGELVGKKAEPAQLRRVITRLLADGPHRPAAASLGAEIRRLDGTSTAAGLVEELARDGAIIRGR